MFSAGLLDLGIDLNLWPWIWMGIAVIFALVELTFLGGTFVLLPFAASAFIASILGFYEVAVEIQWVVFIGGGGIFFYATYRWIRRFISEHDLPTGVGADRLVGLRGYVTSPIDPTDASRKGRVNLEGEVWGALTNGDGLLPTGTRIRVAEVIGTRVIVVPDDSNHDHHDHHDPDHHDPDRGDRDGEGGNGQTMDRTTEGDS